MAQKCDSQPLLQPQFGIRRHLHRVKMADAGFPLCWVSSDEENEEYRHTHTKCIPYPPCTHKHYTHAYTTHTHTHIPQIYILYRYRYRSPVLKNLANCLSVRSKFPLNSHTDMSPNLFSLILTPSLFLPSVAEPARTQVQSSCQDAFS